MADEISYPFSGTIVYQEEATYGAGVTAAAGYLISDAVTDVRIETGDVNKALRCISSPSVVDFSRTMTNPTLHIEWVFQPNTVSAFEELCISRSSCDLSSLAFEIGVNDKCSVGSHYLLEGCKCTSFNMSASQGENWTCTADFSVASIVLGAATVGSPAAIGTAYAAFNIAGGVTWTLAAGSKFTGAHITNSVNISVNNNIQDLYTIGSNKKAAAIPGSVDITGSGDLSIDYGGGNLWHDIAEGKDITSIAFNTGCTAGNSGTITLHNGRFDSGSIDLNTSGEGMISSIPFTFKDIKFTTGT